MNPWRRPCSRFWANSLLNASCHTCDHSRTFFHPHKNSRTSFITLMTDTHFSNCSRKALHSPPTAITRIRQTTLFISSSRCSKWEPRVETFRRKPLPWSALLMNGVPIQKDIGAWFGRDKELKLCFVYSGLLNSYLFFISQRFWQNIFIILPLFLNIFNISESIQTVVVIFVVFNKHPADLFFELSLFVLHWST